MKDVELVIKIPGEIRKAIFDGVYCGISDKRVYDAIKNGTPLPKGHGKLKDADHYIKMQWEHPDYSLTDDEPTIIEADKAESEGLKC